MWVRRWSSAVHTVPSGFSDPGTGVPPEELAPGQSAVVQFPGVRLGKGTHTIMVVTDPDGHVKESNEADNRRQIQVTR